MRNIIFILLFFSLVNAENFDETYKKALEFEANGNYKEAMKWYKKSIQLVTNKQTNIVNRAQENTKQDYTKYLSNIQNNQTEQTVSQIISGLFGLYPYYTNYLLPVVYDKSTHKNRKHFQTQFQISFKKELFSNLLGFDEKYAFGYTQISFWETFKESKPFRESNYQPEIFVYGFLKNKNIPIKGYQIGLLHESNGEDFENSRSWNRIYLSTFWQIENLFIIPRIWYRFPERAKRSINDDGGDDNPDIEDFLGYGDLNIALPWNRHLFKAKLRNNLKFNSKNKGSLELEWTFPLWSKNFFGYINYFTGYGRSLQDYNIHSDRIGIGFAISR